MFNISDIIGRRPGTYELEKPRQRKLKIRDINYLRKVYLIKELEKAKYMEKIKNIYGSENANSSL